MKHPATYSNQLMPLLVELVGDRRPVLDPMAGTGKISEFIPDIWLNELEPEWADQCRAFPCTIATTHDARNLPMPSNSFACVVTSCTYGNRMADHHEAKDTSKRNTYRHTLGHALTPGNTGMLQWGPEYRKTHEQIWREVYRVLQPRGRLILNIKDHVRKGKVMAVSEWHKEACMMIGFVHEKTYQIDCPGNRMGENGQTRIPYENVMVFHKP